MYIYVYVCNVFIMMILKCELARFQRVRDLESFSLYNLTCYWHPNIIVAFKTTNHFTVRFKWLYIDLEM